MIDIKLIRENPEIVKKACKNRGYDLNLNEIIKIDKEYLSSLKKLQELKHKKNNVNQEINKAKKQNKPIKEIIKKAKDLAKKTKELDEKTNQLKQDINKILLTIPAVPDKTVPVGKKESDNKIIKKSKTIPKFKFPVKPHWELGKDLDIIDIPRSIKIAGEGFYVLKGLGAGLSRALINFFLDFHVKDGYTEINPPLLINKKTMTGTGQLPKFEEDLYKTNQGLYLVPTAEVPLANLHQDEILNVEELPKYYCAYTPCFRTEAGKHGTETRGIFRLHQFDKVEMIKICHPDHSEKELEDMRQRVEKLLDLLKIPHRTIVLCTGDMGFAASKTYDIEVWSAFQKKYLETSSCSNCRDFQARRMNTRFRTSKGNRFVHTLNGSGIALPRLLISLIECNQQKDGSIKIPKILQPYMDGIKKIEPKK